MLDEDSLERELSCGICFELYEEPLQLPCMHTFCKGCVRDIINNTKGRKLKCPDCRRNVDLGKNGIDSLKRNFKLASIVEVYRQTLEKTAAALKTSTTEDKPKPAEEADKDYEFLSGILRRSQEDGADPFEPHIIDDLWGTFRRTNRRTSISDRPPIAPPPRTPTNERPTSRPLPPVPRSSPPLIPRPQLRLSQGDQSINDTNSSPVDTRQSSQFSSQERLEATAPPYFSASEVHSHLPAEDSGAELYDLAGMSAPPLPPRGSAPKLSGPRNIDKRPPIPAPRTKKVVPPLPRRDMVTSPKLGPKEGNFPDGRRPPPPRPRGKKP